MKRIRLRCPVCGMSAVNRNLEKNHSLDVFCYDYQGNHKIKVTKIISKKDLVADFWIHKLISISKRLVSEASPITKISLKEFGVEKPDDYEALELIRRMRPN